MGRVLADRVIRGGASSSHFHMSFFLSLFIFVCAFLCRVMYYIPGRTHIVQRRNIAMGYISESIGY
jgi:hypothetical protein